jgi:hypothetical protein
MENNFVVVNVTNDQARLLRWVNLATYKGEDRTNLRPVFVTVSEKSVELLATDGVRMHQAFMPVAVANEIRLHRESLLVYENAGFVTGSFLVSYTGNGIAVLRPHVSTFDLAQARDIIAAAQSRGLEIEAKTTNKVAVFADIQPRYVKDAMSLSVSSADNARIWLRGGPVEIEVHTVEMKLLARAIIMPLRTDGGFYGNSEIVQGHCVVPVKPEPPKVEEPKAEDKNV